MPNQLSHSGQGPSSFLHILFHGIPSERRMKLLREKYGKLNCALKTHFPRMKDNIFNILLLIFQMDL